MKYQVLYVIYIFLLQVIPPGMEFHHIVPHDGDMDGETEGNEDGKSPDPHIWGEVLIFLIIPNLQLHSS